MQQPNIKFVIVERHMSGRYVALRGLSFLSKDEAQSHIDTKFNSTHAKRLSVESRAVKDAATEQRMTCQCCGRKYLAKVGTVAHHGYQRPGDGWQTASCGGAKYLPFEVSRVRLGEVIVSLKAQRDGMIECRNKVNAETAPIGRTVDDTSKPKVWDSLRHRNVYPTITLSVTRENFDALKAEHSRDFTSYSIYTFDVLKELDLSRRGYEIQSIAEYIEESQARYDGWVQTHEWDGKSKMWTIQPARG